MELKHYFVTRNDTPNKIVLIVPFMELKRFRLVLDFRRKCGLNRTFYGIETVSSTLYVADHSVLIVPFMELKPPLPSLNKQQYAVLIVPFMELKLE